MGRHRRRIEDHLLRSVLANRRCQPKRLTPHFEDVQSHCDLPDEFFRLGWTRHSCAYLDDLLSKVNRDQAIAVTDEVNYNRYTKYSKGCRYYFIDESIDVSPVPYLKPGAVT